MTRLASRGFQLDRRGVPSCLPGVLVLVLFGCSSAAQPEPLENFREMDAPPASGSAEAHLVPDGKGLLLSWLEPIAAGHPEGAGGEEGAGAGDGDGIHALRMARLTDTSGAVRWEESQEVVRGGNFFVNWADFPSVVPVGPSHLAAHWLVRGEAGGYDYSIHLAVSSDGGRSWSDAWTPHADGTPTEHGFVSILPLEKGTMGVIWLDGRDYARAESDPERAPEMALRFREIPFGPGAGAGAGAVAMADADDAGVDSGEGAAAEDRMSWNPEEEAGEEIVLDSRVCDCCQTSATRTSAGVVAVYRDRSPDEVRDISAVRLGPAGWSRPAAVHRDDWVINACPVNGPSVAARAERVATAWFTGAGDTPRVRVAFSEDAGESFGDPIRIDEGNPAGRVKVALLADGGALVSWLERADGGAAVYVRRVDGDGRLGRTRTVATTSASRASGFPQMVVLDGGRAFFAWTDPLASDGAGRVRVASADVPGFR